MTDDRGHILSLEFDFDQIVLVVVLVLVLVLEKFDISYNASNEADEERATVPADPRPARSKKSISIRI